MDNFILVVQNSYCFLRGNIPPHIDNAVRRILTYQNDIGAEKAQLLGKLRFFKSRNLEKKYEQTLFKLKELEKTEWICWYHDGVFPTGHLNIVRDLLNNLKANYILEDERSRPESYNILPWVNTPYEPRYYQKDVIDICIKEGRGVVESCVGSGKSLMMTYIIQKLAVNSLVVVPSRGLLEQLYRDFKTWFGTAKVQMIDSKKIKSGTALKPIRIITIQSLAALQKAGLLNKLIDDIDALFLDEFHHAASNSYTNLLPAINHIYYRFGFTGTFIRNDSSILDLWGFLSTRLYEYPAWKAIAEGFLTPLEIHTHELPGIQKSQYQKEYDANYCGSVEILQEILNICTQYSNDQILILVNKKDKSGKIIEGFLKQHGIDISYISGDDKKEDISDTIEAFNEKKVTKLIGTGVIGEGIDIKATDHLIMAQGGKSEIAIVQATGRVVRLSHGKTIARLHDFKFKSTKYMKKHYDQRVNIFKRNFEPVFKET